MNKEIKNAKLNHELKIVEKTKHNNKFSIRISTVKLNVRIHREWDP